MTYWTYLFKISYKDIMVRSPEKAGSIGFSHESHLSSLLEAACVILNLKPHDRGRPDPCATTGTSTGTGESHRSWTARRLRRESYSEVWNPKAESDFGA